MLTGNDLPKAVQNLPSMTDEQLSLASQAQEVVKSMYEVNAFGQGGKLLQSIDRDTQKLAMKCSSIEVNGEQRDVYKSLIADMGKESKKGRVTLYRNDEGYFTDLEGRTDAEEVLETVFENGEIVKEYTFDEVRYNASVII